MTPTELLVLAEHVAAVPHPDLRAAWPRTCAILTRLALEAAIDDVWKHRTGDNSNSTRVSMRAKLLCLRAFVDDAVAEDAAYTWAVLSRACHHHPYELSPSGVELASFLASLKRLVSSLSLADSQSSV